MDYKKSGVDIVAADQLIERAFGKNADGNEQNQESLQRQDELKSKILSRPGDYASVFALNEDQAIALCCDGVGTKLYWTIQGFGSARQLAQDLIAMNVNDLLCVGARPTLFLDYMAFSSSELMKKNGLFENFLRELQSVSAEIGQLLVGGETAQMADLYRDKDFDVAGFSLGVMNKNDLITGEDLKEGDQLWAWESSGPHSNGYSWLRKIYDPEKDETFIRQELMNPTRLYVKEFDVLRSFLAGKSNVKAAFHMTGSGFLNLLRKQPEGREIGFEIDADLLLAREAQWVSNLKERSQSQSAELYRSFNMGYGFAVVLDPVFSQASSSELRKMGLVNIGKATAEKSIRFEGQQSFQL